NGLPDGWEIDKRGHLEYNEPEDQYCFDFLNTGLQTESVLDDSNKFNDDFESLIETTLELLKGGDDGIGILTYSGWDDYARTNGPYQNVNGSPPACTREDTRYYTFRCCSSGCLTRRASVGADPPIGEHP
ncbi:MAG: hypothetical protein R6V03_10570, partial [Kiritimatiellia bacterium]